MDKDRLEKALEELVAIDCLAITNEQWLEVALPILEKLVAEARAEGVAEVELEMKEMQQRYEA